METDSAIDMTTATVSDDQIDVAFSRGSNEACEGAVEGPKRGVAAVVQFWIWSFR